MELVQIVDLKRFPIGDADFRTACSETLDRDGVLVLSGLMTAGAVLPVHDEGVANRDQAYFRSQNHTVYLSPPDRAFAFDYTRNR